MQYPTREQIEELAAAVLDGLAPSSLSDTELTLVHFFFEEVECALPPAGLVAEEIERRLGGGR